MRRNISNLSSESIGLLSYQNPTTNKLQSGLAFMINPLHILTLAQYAYDRKHKVMNHKFRFYPGLNGQTDVYNNVVSVKIEEIYKDGDQQKAKSANYCLMTLDVHVTRPSYIALNQNFDYHTHQINVLGYQKVVLNDNKMKANQSAYSYETKGLVIQNSLFLTHDFESDSVLLCEKQSFLVAIRINGPNQDNKPTGINITKQLIKFVKQSIGPVYFSQLNLIRLEKQQIKQNQSFEERKIPQIQKYLQKERNPKIQENHQKFVSNVLSDSERLRRERLSGYIEFSISGCYIEYITVNGIRLYYELYGNKTSTISDLQRQYKQIRKMELNLEYQDKVLDKNSKVSSYINTQEDAKKFEVLLNEMNPAEHHDYSSEINYQQRCQKQQQKQPFFHSQCRVRINYLHKRIQYIQSFEKRTTFLELISKIRIKYKINSKILQIKSKKQMINENQVCHHLQDLQVSFQPEKSYFSQNTKISIENQLVKLSSLSKKQLPLEIQSYDVQLRPLQIEKMYINSHKFIYSYIRIYFANNSQQFMIECTPDTLVLLKDKTQIKVQNLQIGQEIRGVDKKNIVSYMVKRKQQIKQTQALIFYNLSGRKTCSFIANNLFVQSNEAIDIRVSIDGQQPSLMQIAKAQAIKSKFQDMPVYIGDNELDRNLTFEDYCIDPMSILHVFKDLSSLINRTQLQITEWTTWNFGIDEAQHKKINGQINKQSNKNTEIQKSKLHNFYAAIYQNKLMELTEQALNSFVPRSSALIVAHKIYFQKMRHISRLNKCKEFQFWNQYSERYQDREFLDFCKQHNSNDKYILFPIFWYTLDLYKQVNYFQKASSLPASKNQTSKIKELGRCLDKIKRQNVVIGNKEYLGRTVFRGVKDTSLLPFLNKTGHIILFQGFTSTSKTIESVMDNNFAQDGLIFQIRTSSGKLISKFSYYDKKNSLKNEQQILLREFRYFVIEGYYSRWHNSIAYPIIKLRQIPLPDTDKKKIVFLVDDKPNDSLLKSLNKNNKFQGQIEAVEVEGNQAMEVILRNFFRIQRLLNKKIVIISNMTRMQNEEENIEAGVDLLKIVYNELGLSVKVIIYCEHAGRAWESITTNNINSNRWCIYSQTYKVIKQVEAQFN